MMMLTEKQINIGAVKLSYAEGPASGPPLVLLHGGSARWQSFVSIIPDLIDDWHILAPDLRGHGNSGRAQGRYRLRDYMDDILRFLDACVAEKAILVGHSLGGMVSIMLAAQQDADAQAVVVGDAPLTKASWLAMFEESRDRVAAWHDLAGGKHPISAIIDELKDSPVEVPGEATPKKMRQLYGEESPVFEWLATNLYHNDPDMLAALLHDTDKMLAGYDIDQLLPNIHCPVLLLQADPAAGGLMTEVDVERAMALLPKPFHTRLPDVSHDLHHRHKGPVLTAIKHFLSGV